jgi:Uma2 family endonuclease
MGLMTGYDGALPNPRGVKLTYDDFVLFPDDGLRHELIDGEHYVTPSPNDKHQTILANLLLLIGPWVRAHAAGKVWIAPFDVVLSRSDVVEPDLLYMSNQRKAEVLTDANVQGPPELVVEVGSPSTRRRDETIKRALYERAGVSEYWFVDAELDVVRIYRRLDGGRFARPEQLSLKAGDVLTTPLLVGLDLPLGEIFRN